MQLKVQREGGGILPPLGGILKNPQAKIWNMQQTNS